MGYKDKVLDHFENPRNVGSLDTDAADVGTGLVGAPACGDVMRLQIRVEERLIRTRCLKCKAETTFTDGHMPADFRSPCGHGAYENLRGTVIVDAKFKTFGCGSAIASSSLATEWIKGKTVDEAEKIENAAIVEELNLPPVKIHCSVLAEDAIKAAIADYRKKRAARPGLPEFIHDALVPLPAPDAPEPEATAPPETESPVALRPQTLYEKIKHTLDPFDPPPPAAQADGTDDVPDPERDERLEKIRRSHLPTDAAATAPATRIENAPLPMEFPATPVAEDPPARAFEEKKPARAPEPPHRPIDPFDPEGC